VFTPQNKEEEKKETTFSRHPKNENENEKFSEKKIPTDFPFSSHIRNQIFKFFGVVHLVGN
jgi:hypothetical protein